MSPGVSNAAARVHHACPTAQVVQISAAVRQHAACIVSILPAFALALAHAGEAAGPEASKVGEGAAWGEDGRVRGQECASPRALSIVSGSLEEPLAPFAALQQRCVAAFRACVVSLVDCLSIVRGVSLK